MDLGKVFAGNVEIVREVVISGGDDDFFGAIDIGAAEGVSGEDFEVAVTARDGFDQAVKARIERIVLGNFAVILQSLIAYRLLIWTGKWYVADLEQLRSSEERHVRGVVEDGVAEASLVDQHTAKAGALRLDGTCHSGWAGANYKNIELLFARFQAVGRVAGSVAHVCRLDDLKRQSLMFRLDAAAHIIEDDGNDKAERFDSERGGRAAIHQLLSSAGLYPEPGARL